MEETKVIYHLNDEDTPYLIKLPISADKITLGDLKNALGKPNYKYFFKSMDDDFGCVCVKLELLTLKFPLILTKIDPYPDETMAPKSSFL